MGFVHNTAGPIGLESRENAGSVILVAIENPDVGVHTAPGDQVSIEIDRHLIPTLISDLQSVERDPDETVGSPRLVFLDVETGGLETRHSLLQIGMAVEGGDYISSYVGVERGSDLVVDPAALAVNGIDLRDAGSWPRPAAVRSDIDRWLNTHDLLYRRPLQACGFNVRFDVDRINRLYPGLFSHRVLDLVSVAAFHGLPETSQELMDWAGVPRDGRHDAGFDALAARTVYRKMSCVRDVGSYRPIRASYSNEDARAWARCADQREGTIE